MADLNIGAIHKGSHIGAIAPVARVAASTPETIMHPFGGVIHFPYVNETYMHPFGGVVANSYQASTAGGGATAKPWGHHLLDRQHAAIAAHRLGGLLQ